MNGDIVKPYYEELQRLKEHLPFWDEFKKETNEEKAIAQWLQTHKLVQIKLIGDKKNNYIITGYMLDLVKKYLLNPSPIDPIDTDPIDTDAKSGWEDLTRKKGDAGAGWLILTRPRKNSDSFKKAMVMDGFVEIRILIEALGEPKEKVARFLSGDFNLETFDRYYKEAKAKYRKDHPEITRQREKEMIEILKLPASEQPEAIKKMLRTKHKEN